MILEVDKEPLPRLEDALGIEKYKKLKAQLISSIRNAIMVFEHGCGGGIQVTDIQMDTLLMPRVEGNRAERIEYTIKIETNI